MGRKAEIYFKNYIDISFLIIYNINKDKIQLRTDAL